NCCEKLRITTIEAERIHAAHREAGHIDTVQIHLALIGQFLDICHKCLIIGLIVCVVLRSYDVRVVLARVLQLTLGKYGCSVRGLHWSEVVSRRASTAAAMVVNKQW